MGVIFISYEILKIKQKLFTVYISLQELESAPFLNMTTLRFISNSTASKEARRLSLLLSPREFVQQFAIKIFSF